MVLWVKRSIQSQWAEFAKEFTANEMAKIDLGKLRESWTNFTPSEWSKDDKTIRNHTLAHIEELEKDPVRCLTSLEIVLEQPIMNNKFIVGYADLRIWGKSVSFTGKNYRPQSGNDVLYDLLGANQSYEFPEIFRCHIEVKPRINSLGEILRQIRTYQQYSGRWAVASPDRRFEQENVEQGIMFLPIPPSYNQQPNVIA